MNAEASGPGAVDRARRWIVETPRRYRIYRMEYRKLFRRDGVLPDLLIIGAMKSGTTTLFEMLAQHPGFVPPEVKEIQFFNHPRNRARGEAWYRAHFPRRGQMDQLAGVLGYRPVTGEATPAMSVPFAAEQTARLVPDARLVVSLRNPVERAWSHYQHMRRHPLPERASFAEALERELAYLNDGVKLTPENYHRMAPLLHRFGYVNRGQYAEQLERWFAHFPREHFLFLNFDQWVNDPASATARIAEHVGLPEHEFEVTVANPGRYRSSMPEDCRERLTEHFRPWNRRLFDLLDESWGWPC